jgi:hypothetical protein
MKLQNSSQLCKNPRFIPSLLYPVCNQPIFRSPILKLFSYIQKGLPTLYHASSALAFLVLKHVMLRHKICIGIDVTSSSPGTRHHTTRNRSTDLSKEPAASVPRAKKMGTWGTYEVSALIHQTSQYTITVTISSHKLIITQFSVFTSQPTSLDAHY